MSKTLTIVYALILILMFIVGAVSIFYGLLIFFKPLAYVAIGIFLCLLAYTLNQSYERKGGDR